MENVFCLKKFCLFFLLVAAPFVSLRAAPYQRHNSFAWLRPVIATAGEKYGVSPALLVSVIHQESGGNPKATSRHGAMGLMQLMPKTARWLGVTHPYSVWDNVLGGTRYLGWLISRFKGNLAYALAAYNAGPGAVRRFGGIPPNRETQNYVKRILKMYSGLLSRGEQYPTP